MEFALILWPLFCALVAFLLPADRMRTRVLPVAAVVHLVLSLAAVARLGPLARDEWLQLDPLGAVTLIVVSVLFLVCALYAPAYFDYRADRPNRIIVTCMLAFMSMASVIILAQHLGLMWVAVEGTTLAIAPMIYFNRTARSLEATWKYLMVGSVGIALALLGSLFLAYSTLVGGHEVPLLFGALLENASVFSQPWLRAAFVLLLVGYGTKMGLAPLHTWKPDVYGEAPAIVGALLAGGMTSCAFLALLRVYRIVAAAGQGAFARELLVVMGMVSIGLAAAFMVRQSDFKRMLAYSSVEHMGILVLGIGMGGVGTYGSVLHIVNNGWTKGIMFLAAGNIHRAFRAKTIPQVGGAMERVPVSASLFLVGFFAVTGSPPFGPFISEFTILQAMINGGSYAVAAAFLLLLTIVFIGMGATVLDVVQGTPSDEARQTRYVDDLRCTGPLLLSMALVVLMGVWIPEPLRVLLVQAAQDLEVAP